jgi:hypothetical protein
METTATDQRGGIEWRRDVAADGRLMAAAAVVVMRRAGLR